MVEQIFDDKILEEEILNNAERCIRFILNQEQINEWKESGKFSFLKKELRNISKMKFACTQNDDDGVCAYYFVCNTKEMADRMLTMLRELYIENNKVPLLKCKYTDVQKHKDKASNRLVGSVKACTLF